MRDSRSILGIIIILLGISFLFRFNFWSVLWPVILIFLGLKIITDGNKDNGKKLLKEETSKEDEIYYETIFNGLNKKVVSENFSGGKATVVFGGGELDLREAKMEKDGVAELSVDCVFGGIKIIVPETWIVTTSVTGVAGGFENKTEIPKSGKENGRLKIRGSAVFGGGEVVN